MRNADAVEKAHSVTNRQLVPALNATRFTIRSNGEVPSAAGTGFQHEHCWLLVIVGSSMQAAAVQRNAHTGYLGEQLRHP
jgi:hypothetical protein